MKITEIFIKSSIIIFLGWFIIYLDKTLFVTPLYAEVIIPLVAFLKILFFIYQSYQIVIKVIEHNILYHKFVIMEDLVSFMTILYVLTDFVTLKQSIEDSNFMKKRNEKPEIKTKEGTRKIS